MERYHHPITVPASAIDALGHANNTEYVRWIQDAAVAHSEHLGYSTERYLALGGAWVVRKHVVEYLRPVLEGESLTAATWIAGGTRVQCERHTELTNAKGEVVAKGVTTWVFVSLGTMRPMRIPDTMLAAFGMA